MSLAERLKAEAFARKQVDQSNKTEEVKENQEQIIEDNKEIEAKEDESQDESLDATEVQKRTVESYEDEIKRLREENAKRRKREQEAKEKALVQAEEIFKTEREMYEQKIAELSALADKVKEDKLKEADKEIDKEIKAKEENSKLEGILKQLDELKKRNEEAEKILREQKEREEEERSLRKQAATNRFNSLLKEIPEDQHKFAMAMFKGYEDPQEGLLAVSEAKTSGIFGKKKIEVVHTSPKTYTPKSEENKVPVNKKQKLTEAIKSRRSNLTPGSRLT